MRDSRREAEITVQSMPDVLGRWYRLTARVDTSCEMIQQKNKKYISSVLDLFAIPNFYIREGPATWSQVREERRLQRIPHGKTTSKEVVERNNTKTFTIEFIRDTLFRKDDDRVGSL